MKTCKLIHPLKFKSGEIWEVGTLVNVSVEEDRPFVAIVSKNGDKKMIRSANLYHYFQGFIKYTEKDMEAGIMDGICKSLTGARVEPDGWDSEGFPSILLANALI